MFKGWLDIFILNNNNYMLIQYFVFHLNSAKENDLKGVVRYMNVFIQTLCTLFEKYEPESIDF